MAQDSSLSALDFTAQQGWLGDDHIAWLRHMAEKHHDGTRQDPEERAVESRLPPEAASSRIEVDENAILLPTDIDFEVHLAEDGALAHLHEYLRIGQYYDASDVHLGVRAPPMMRRHGCLQIMWPRAPIFRASQTERLVMGFITEEQKKHFKEQGDLDFCYAVEGMGRFRTSVVNQKDGVDGVFRIINSKVRTMDDLGLPPQLKGLTKYNNGLVLITGSVGCGKSTTMAAFIEEVNRTRSDHIITLEDPIEYIFEPKGCQITQREVRLHTESFARSLLATLREDPDVIMIGEMRDLETISLAITAAETGHLVFGTLHTNNAARTLDRILDVFPIDQQAHIRTMVAGSLRGIISQQLVPRRDGQGRVLVLEILINTPAAAALIRESKTFMLPGVIQTGKKLGCRLMDDSLLGLLKNGVITAQEAFERVEQKALLKPYFTK